MKRISIIMAAVLVVGTLAFPVAGVVAQETDTQTQTETPTDDADENATVSPGERLAGVVGVQEAEFDGEIENRGLQIAIERADDNASKTLALAQTANDSEARLAELEERREDLEAQREDGSISEGQYRAEMATLAVELDNVERQLNTTNETASELPEDVLEANGVNTTAIETLKQNASELGGQEVAEIARSIAGNERGEVERGDAAEERGDRDGEDERDTEETDGQDRDETDRTAGNETTETERSETTQTEGGAEGDAEQP